jgi:hypothetical protein
MFLRCQTLSSAEACLLDRGWNRVHGNNVGHVWRCRHVVVCGQSADEKLQTTFNKTQFLGNKFNYASALLNSASKKIN